MVTHEEPARFATLCSGIEAVSLAWEPIGMVPIFFSEIEAFPNSVLLRHWPRVPNLGDITRIDGLAWRGKIDVLWGSFPCQDYSIAGQQRSLSGDRGALTLAGVRVVDEIDPPIFCFENVKNLLSQKDNAFGHFLGRLAGEDGPLKPPGKRWTHAGYVLGPRRRVAWRLLNAEYFGLPQRRERVFVVACPNGGADPREILFERQDPSGVSPACARAQARIAAGVGCSPDPIGSEAYTVSLRGREGGAAAEVGGNVASCLRASQGGGDKAFVLYGRALDWQLRRLMPVECERLMGLPDNHTLIPWKGGEAPDSLRYHAIGNSLAVPVVRWLGERVLEALRASRSKVLT